MSNVTSHTTSRDLVLDVVELLILLQVFAISTSEFEETPYCLYIKPS